MIKTLLPVLVITFPLFALQESAAAQDLKAQDTEAVLFMPQVVNHETHCVVGFAVTYPQDVAAHSRHIRVTTTWSEASQDNPWPIPSLGAPDSLTDNKDGTVTFSGAVNESIGGCDPELTARTLAIGPCADGECPPARFVPDEAAARLGLGEAQY